LTIGRVAAALLVLGVLVALGAYWIGPGVVPRADLHLLALDAGSRFTEDAILPAADSMSGTQPLILAVSNTGQRSSEARSVLLSAPGWVRFHSSTGPVEPTDDRPDEPLRRYAFPLGGDPIEPGALPRVPGGLGRMSVSADVPLIACRLRWDGVPEFVPAPPWDAAKLASVSIFYSIEGDRDRHTGVLRLQLDTTTPRSGSAGFSAGNVVISRPGPAVPATDSLRLLGEGGATCGAPGRRVALEATVWRTGGGRGRLFVIRTDSLARRLLFDADGDGRIERESWDGDSDGFFEASRPVQFVPPRYLIPSDTTPLPLPPVTPPPVPPATRVDTMRRDTSGAGRRVAPISRATAGRG